MSKTAELGARIASIRTLRGLRQTDLAKRVGVSSQTICNWETGARVPRADLLGMLCDVLDCSSDYLLGLDDHVTRSSRSVS